MADVDLRVGSAANLLSTLYTPNPVDALLRVGATANLFATDFTAAGGGGGPGARVGDGVGLLYLAHSRLAR